MRRGVGADALPHHVDDVAASTWNHLDTSVSQVVCFRAVVVAFLVIGLAFHLGCAVLMGLNSFLWAFPAAYPCVLASREILGWG